MENIQATPKKKSYVVGKIRNNTDEKVDATWFDTYEEAHAELMTRITEYPMSITVVVNNMMVKQYSFRQRVATA